MRQSINMKTKCAAHYQGSVHNILISKEKSLLDELRANKIPVPFSCGGEGICTTCRIIVLSGELTDQTEVEKERADERGFSDNERLSCQAFTKSDSIEIKVP